MKHSVPHDLPIPLAKKAADAALTHYQERFAEYDPEVTWTTTTTAEVVFRAKGMAIKGLFEVLEDEVAMELEVPLLLRPFRQKALDVVEEEITKWIGKAKAGKLV
jgi:hypothetical protein